MNTALTQRAYKFAIDRHNATGCVYDGKPYAVHIDDVLAWGDKFMYSINPDRQETIVCALALHDVIEDCRVTYNDLVAEFGKDIADIVYDVSNEMGKDRTERALKTYNKIRTNNDAILVKGCDRLANTSYSKQSGSSMYRKYIKEYPMFRYCLFNGHQGLWQELDKLHGLPS